MADKAMVLNEVVCRAIPDPGILDVLNASSVRARGENEGVLVVAALPLKRTTPVDLRALSSAQLLALLQDASNRPSKNDLHLIEAIAQERAGRSQSELRLADQLISTCQALENSMS